MATLLEIIPQILIPHLPDQRQPPSQPTTARYAPVAAPPQHHVPYWIAHSPSLADWMMQSLHAYLMTAPGSNIPPSRQLRQCINDLPDNLLETPAGELSSEETTSHLWDIYLFPLIRYAVRDVDQNLTLPAIQVRRTLYSQTPDVLICPTKDTPPRLHREDKSWTVFDTFAPDILMLAQHVEDGQTGTALELRVNEEGARSIVMKMGVSMIGNPSIIPYGILFGGHRFMLFSLFRNADTLGEIRYGLTCSNIIDCTNVATPLIPLIIFTLLGNSNDLQLYQPTFTIPPVPTPVIQDKDLVTRSKFRNFVSKFPTKGKAIFHIHTPSGATSRSLLLYHQSTLQAVENPFASSASLIPFDQIEISLTKCIGHGASGQVFLGTTDDEKYAIKIAPWKIGKQMLQREAGIYEILSDLQGRCIPKIYGFFSSEHLKALFMDYMGCTVGKISDLSMDQRHQLLEELYLVHEYGVRHGDLQASNIVLQNGSAHFIDFSHSYEHPCTGRATCSELIEARQFLL